MPPPLYQRLSEPLSTKLTVPAHHRITELARTSGMNTSEVMRSLMKVGWAYLNDGQNFDMPIGTHVLLEGFEDTRPAAERELQGVS
jgi:hypothetical protein